MTGMTAAFGIAGGFALGTAAVGKEEDSTVSGSFLKASSDLTRFYTGASSPRLFDARGELLHEVVDAAVLLDELGDLGGCVDDGRVVAAAELLADLRERAVGELAAEVHRYLTRIDDRL